MKNFFLFCLALLTAFIYISFYNLFNSYRNPVDIIVTTASVPAVSSQIIVNFQSNKVNKQELKFKLITNPFNICKIENLNVFIYVFIAVNNFAVRDAIRQTWANKINLNDIRVAFILGLSREEEINKKVIQENDKYNDIIQADFYDAYRNLTFKSVITWKWISDNCNHAKHIIKVDDDTLPNIFGIRRFLQDKVEKDPNQRLTFYCQTWFQMVVQRHGTKWLVTDEEYDKSKKFYDPYCNGIAYIYDNRITPELYQLSLRTRFFWIDDVYVGMVANNLNVTYFDMHYNYLHYDTNPGAKNFSVFLFVRNLHSNDQYLTIWNRLKINS